MRAVIYSGGLDSYTLLHDVIGSAVRSGEDPTQTIHALSFNYGQRHKKELGYARDECARLGIKHSVVDLRDVGALLTGSALTSDMAMPHGHYTDENMKQTVVPGRNTIMLSIAMAVAEQAANASSGSGRAIVYYGAHSGDHFIYPDCRPLYVMAMHRLMLQATDQNVSLSAPYLHMSKGGIVSLGNSMGLDYSRTWTCYEGGEQPCGKCGACVERAEAFEQAGIPDPLITPKEATA